MPLWDDEKESIWMLPGYMDAIQQAGGIPIIFPFSTDESELAQLTDMCNGILFTGGQDVSPQLYNEPCIGDVVSCCAKRDVMESIVLKMVIDTDKSVLGICRGIQFFNVAFGGSLYQDLSLQHPSSIVHCQNIPYDIPVHEVILESDSPLFDCLGVARFSVNSYHHQAIKELAVCLEVMAKSSDDLVEAVYLPSKKFFWAVQWHPEFSFLVDDNSRKIFEKFVGSMESP